MTCLRHSGDRLDDRTNANLLAFVVLQKIKSWITGTGSHLKNKEYNMTKSMLLSTCYQPAWKGDPTSGWWDGVRMLWLVTAEVMLYSGVQRTERHFKSSRCSMTWYDGSLSFRFFRYIIEVEWIWYHVNLWMHVPNDNGNEILDHSKASCRFAFHESSKLPSIFVWFVLWGIDVENFFKWNQLTIHQSDGMWAEYVHLQAWCQHQVAGVTPSHRPGRGGIFRRSWSDICRFNRWILCDQRDLMEENQVLLNEENVNMFVSPCRTVKWKTVRKMVEKFRFPYVLQGFLVHLASFLSPLWISGMLDHVIAFNKLKGIF